MKKQNIIEQWVQSIHDGTFLTVKHDPNDITTLRNRRSIVTTEVSASLKTFIESGNYTINQYINTNPRHNPQYYELIPDSGSFNPTGGIVATNTQYTSSQCDRLVVVSGSGQGWHMFAEEASVIHQKTVDGALIFSGSV